MTLLTDHAVWQELDAYYFELKSKPLQPIGHYVMNVAGLSVDYSRHYLNDTALQLFSELADSCGLSSAIDRLISGRIVNFSERRAAWHTMLRDPEQQTHEITQCFQKMRHSESLVNQQGITDIIHVGIGGSYLGPRFLYDAFASMADARIQCHFIANQNIAAIQKLLAFLDPKKTLLIIVSKSFTTVETVANAKKVIIWLQSALPKIWQDQVMAITAEAQRARNLGVLSTNIFPLWDWLGGRFSLWSAVSLSLVFAFGWEMFQKFLSGAYEIDQHFQSQVWTANVPVILAFLSLVYRHFFQAQTQAIIPYHNALTRLPSYLQQLHMESLAKQVSQLGQPIHYPTGAIIWGGTGPGSQHSFHQLLLQGSDLVPVDFIAVTEDEFAYRNCLAQAMALCYGNQNQEIALYQRLLGNRPSSLISMSSLTPQKVGALLAMYEHKVFTQAILWNINPFDQYGVEAGKKLLRAEFYETEA